jgi:hypothetical protein
VINTPHSSLGGNGGYTHSGSAAGGAGGSAVKREPSGPPAGPPAVFPPSYGGNGGSAQTGSSGSVNGGSVNQQGSPWGYIYNGAGSGEFFFAAQFSYNNSYILLQLSEAVAATHGPAMLQAEPVGRPMVSIAMAATAAMLPLETLALPMVETSPTRAAA